MGVSLFGIYVHIPFCLRKCDYCDFYSMPIGRKPPPHEEYLKAMLAQLDADAPAFAGRRVSTIYFGGGTPSLMPPGFFESLLSSIARRFSIEAGAEISCEANPATADLAWLRRVRSTGITRLSIGVQSFQDRLLEVLGRAHTSGEAMRAIAEAQDAGFDSVSLDLMYAIPGETSSDLEEDVRTAMTFQPQHISAYQLTLEQGTLLHERFSAADREKFPSDEEQLKQMRIVARMLDRGGWRRYEISNFARPGFECRNNLNYWRYGEYLGLGAGATSHGFARRWTQARDAAAYIAGKVAPAEDEAIGRRTAMAEFCFMGLRAVDGISSADFKRLFGEEFEEVFPGEAGVLVGEGLASQEGGRLALTQRGIEISNRVFERFMA